MSDRYKGAILSPTAPTVTPQSAGGIYTSSQQLQYQGQGVWPQAFNNPINNSLRFRSSASAYLTRTYSTPTNSKIWTFSAWVKRGKLDAGATILNGNSSASQFYFASNNTLIFYDGTSGAEYITTQVFRDPSAWYHIVVAMDTTQATAGNRTKIYVNGSQVTAFGTATAATQNNNSAFNVASTLFALGVYYPTPSNYFDGYMAEVNFIDGTQLTPSSFGTTDAYGIWQPIPYTGAYGTNGFYLPFYNSTTLGTSVTASYLMVAGGGAGGAAGGGGGAGGLLTGTTSLSSTANYVVTVGAGGAGGSGVGAQGGNTSFIGLTAIGGGGGAYGTSGISATTGGSGGGGSVNAVTGAAGTSGQGFAGGNGINTDSFAGGGGGGASAVGSNATTVAGGNGGAGTASSISGSSVTYAGGGGGGGYNGSTAGTGGAGGGGNGASSGAGASGTANRGGGGGGGANGGNGGSGGSGIVIVSYAGSQRYVGGTVTTSGGNTIHTFTSSGTLTVLGNDYSGNNNTWTLNNISLTPGSTYDSMKDVPTNTNSNTANYAVINPLNNDPAATGVPTLTNGNLTATGGNQKLGIATIGTTTGKFYWEYTVLGVPTTPTMHLGITTSPFVSSYLRAYRYDTGDYFNGTAWISYGATWTTNDVIGVAVDMTSQTIEFFKNGTSQGQKTSIGLTDQTMFPYIYINDSPGSVAMNYGQQPFAYTPPSGFYPLNTYNLPTPTILAGDDYFNAVLYTGTGSSQSITGLDFQPDLVWIKSRNNAGANHLIDAVRGIPLFIFSDSTAGDTSRPNSFTSFNSNGFTVGSSSDGNTNLNTYTYVAWNWRASNAAGVSNTQGTITSTVSANTTAGFSIVTFTGTGANATVGHGLGVAPSIIIVKNRSAVWDWPVYSSVFGGTQVAFLSLTNGFATNASYWNNTNATSSVFSIGTNGAVSGNTNNFVAYCFSQVAGYSAFGSYAGNGSTDGPFIFTGFKPAFIMIKLTSSGGEDWTINDDARNTYNVSDAILYPNSSSAEGVGSGAYIDFLSNGFKIRNNNPRNNASSSTYIYACFAESPFKISRAR